MTADDCWPTVGEKLFNDVGGRGAAFVAETRDSPLLRCVRDSTREDGGDSRGFAPYRQGARSSYYLSSPCVPVISLYRLLHHGMYFPLLALAIQSPFLFVASYGHSCSFLPWTFSLVHSTRFRCDTETRCIAFGNIFRSHIATTLSLSTPPSSHHLI